MASERFVKLTLDDGECGVVYVNPRNVTHILPHKAESSPDASVVGTSVFFVTTAWYFAGDGIYLDHVDVLESPKKVYDLFQVEDDEL